VIERYTREEMGAVWTPQRRMETWLEVELAATDAWVEEGSVPAEAAAAIRERASFTVEAVQERERTTGHDVAAFVDVVSDSVGEHGRWLHYGLTSSDVLDTALAIQLREAGAILVAGTRPRFAAIDIRPGDILTVETRDPQGRSIFGAIERRPDLDGSGD
jgi:adenylosuccinate lyase